MDQSVLEEGEGDNRAPPSTIPQNLVGTVGFGLGRLLLPRQRSGVHPRGEVGEERVRQRRFFWDFFVPRQRSKPSLQNEADVSVTIISHSDHIQPQEHASSDGSTHPPPMGSIGGYLPQFSTESPPQVIDFSLHSMSEPPQEHGMEEIIGEGSKRLPTSPGTPTASGYESPYSGRLHRRLPAPTRRRILVTGGCDPPSPKDSANRNPIPGPPQPEGTATLTERFNEYKLETKFYDGYLVHKTFKWKRWSSSRSWEESTWKRRGRIGSGNFGTVWLEEEEERGELRAVKMIPRNPLQEASQSHELLALVKLKEYDYLFVNFLGWYEDIDYTFLAMEYIEHGDLSEFMKDPRAKTEAKEITKQILEGLEVLHGKGIYHRDLKPQNILMASLDPIWVKIADFGLSKRTKNTQIRTLAGTQGYLAPELLGIVPKIFLAQGFIPHALDIWSLGSLVHELLTTETPFTDTDTGEDLGSISGLQTELLSERGTNIASLVEYCHSGIGFPADVLERSQVDKEGVAFVKSLLIANPMNRPTPTQALQDSWLMGYKYTSDWVENLKNEFSCIGADLDLNIGFVGNKSIGMRQFGKEDIIRFLPSSSKEPEEVVSSLLLRAAAQGYNLAILKLLESRDYGLVSMNKSVRGKLFQIAAEAGQLDTIKLLLRKKVNIRAFVDGETVIQWAIKAEYVNIVNLFLSVDDTADVRTSRDYKKAFLLAATFGNPDMVKVFLINKFDINASSGHNKTGLQAAAGSGHIDIVKLLLDNKADVNAEAGYSSGRTALQAAAGGSHIDIFKLLLDNMADVNAQASYAGRTALQAAAEGGHIDIVKLLLDNKADVNAEAETIRDRTVLQAAAGGGNMDIVKLLLDNKADVNAGANGGLTALQAASEGGHINIVKLLLDNKADVNARTDRSLTALQMAAEGGHIDIFKLLLDKKADVNARGGRGPTALQAASGGGHIDIVKLLLDNKADVNAEGAIYSGQTALHAAITGGHIDTIKLILDKSPTNRGIISRGSRNH